MRTDLPTRHRDGARFSRGKHRHRHHLAGLMLRNAVLLLLIMDAFAQPAPKHYTCVRASPPMRIDGRLDDAAWRKAPWTDDFVDIQGAGHPQQIGRASCRGREE